MSYDGIFTHVIINELKKTIKNGRITKIHQPFPHELLLTVRANRQNKKLLLSAHPAYARVQLTEESLSNPEFAPNFCMFLRKNVEGAQISSIEQQGNDRIIIFHIKKMDELGDWKHLLLIVELMGRHSNIFLVNKETGIIMDCLKHVPSYKNSYRPIHPGAPYQLPPHQDKLNPFAYNLQEAADSWENLPQTAVSKKIQTLFQGIGKDSAAEIAASLEQDKKSLDEALEEFKKSVSAGPPSLYTEENGKQSFAPFPYRTLQGERETFESPSLLLDRYYSEKASRDRIRQTAADLLTLIRNEIQKNALKLEKLRNSLQDSRKADDFRVKGELLTAYLHEVPKGAQEVVLPNFYDEEKALAISLDPALTANQNAQKYFSKYQKLVHSVKYIQEQIKKTEEENSYLDSVETQIHLSDPQDLEEIREELKNAGYIKKKNSGKGKNKKQKASKPYLFRSSDGTNIRVGKNNVQNDQLTLKTAKKNHVWLHTKDIPGSHVVIEHSDPSEETLLEAANIAAYYSKFQQSANVPVDYTMVKNVHKPNGAKPGFVVYTGQKTLYVNPEKTIVESLKN